MENKNTHMVVEANNQNTELRSGVLKKDWIKPQVIEISRFAILGGGDPVKTEGAGTVTASL
jgi:hypothetical protein